uniref:Uncharacterized protein n=1 Tax=Arundo donax TaxID=35708 RepID=A0A0A9AWY1_ARUDO
MQSTNHKELKSPSLAQLQYLLVQKLQEYLIFIQLQKHERIVQF